MIGRPLVAAAVGSDEEMVRLQGAKRVVGIADIGLFDRIEMGVKGLVEATEGVPCRMVLELPDHPRHLGLEDRRRPRLHRRGCQEPLAFRLQQHADFIRGLEELAQRRVGEEANGVEAVVLQVAQTLDVDRLVRRRRAVNRLQAVVTTATQKERPVVEQEVARVGVGDQGAKPRADGLAIPLAGRVKQRHLDAVEVRVFGRPRAQFRKRQPQFGRAGHGGVGGESQRRLSLGRRARHSH